LGWQPRVDKLAGVRKMLAWIKREKH
jgi:hypothetical protein